MARREEDGTESTVTGAVGATRDWSGAPTEVDLPPGERTLPAGSKVGRYTIVELIGRGGMGVVYRAHDPELDREIALKLLRPARSKGAEGERARSRLLREAQALARLSHPNVVAVYDAGTFEGAVFLAMELVEGRDLGRWVRRDHPPQRAVIAAYVAAGRGLAAAHAAGIIHRDFKPSNVLRGRDGRVRVVDFGLAKPLGDDTPVDEPLTSTASTASGETSSIDQEITRAGQIVGTPKYMALEQMTARPTGEHSDQFSFCVALWEALYGERPYTGRTLRELGERMKAHEIREPPRGRRVPRWLRRILSRGLMPEPADRHPSMTAMLDAIEAVPRRRRRIALAATAVAVAGGLTGGVAALERSADGSCGGDGALAASAWSDARQRAVGEAFAASGRERADAAFERFRQLGDRFADRWSQLQVAACRAHRDGSRSDRHYDLQVQCLEQRRAALDELTRRYQGHVTREQVDRALTALAELGDLEACGDPAILASSIEPPAASQRSAVDQLRRTIARAQVLRLAGDFGEGARAAHEAVDRARELDYAPALAEALLALATLYDASDDREGAVANFTDAAEVGSRAHHDRVIALAWIGLLWDAGYVARDRARADIAGVAARSAVARAGGGAELEANLENALGSIDFVEARYDDALPRFTRVLELRRQVFGDDAYQLAGPLTNLGLIHYRKGDYARAKSYHERALALREGALGPDHPDLASTLNNLGIAAERSGDLDGALAHYRRALAIREGAFGRDHKSIGGLVNNIGNIYLRRRQPAEAETYLRRALAIKRAALGDRHPRVTTSLDNLTEALLMQQRYDDAIALAHESLAISRDNGLADHPDTAYAMTHLGNAYLGKGDPRAAAEILARALALREKHAAPAAELGETRFSLARAEWELGRRERARGLATAAAVELRTGGDSAAHTLAEAEAWLTEHGR